MSSSVIIGIAGGTGAGKTTIARKLIEPMPKGSVAILEHDAYYRDRSDLTMEERNQLNYDHPDALDNDLFYEQLGLLKSGQAIEKPVYNFVTHRRQEERIAVEAHPVIIVEGILLFVERRLRELMDIKIFVDTPSDIRVLRRIRRDMEDRGRSFDSIRKQYYETVRPMHQEFVEPTKRFADIIIPEGDEGNLDIALDLLIERIRRAVG